MILANVKELSDGALQGFDKMMDRYVLTVKTVSPMAMSIWREVLKELEERGLVNFVSGSYDNIRQALIARIHKK